ncbi:MAG: hypothetical protein Q8P89_02500 [bacterium]|nr:hypothetical protein [bacterium]
MRERIKPVNQSKEFRERLAVSHYETVVISADFGPSEAIAGLILSKLDITSPNAKVVVREHRQFPTDFQTSCLIIFQSELLNPQTLYHLIDQRGDKIDWHLKTNLKRLVSHTQFYRGLPRKDWNQAEQVLQKNPSYKTDLYLYNLLRYISLSFDFPLETYQGYQKTLNNLVSRPDMDLENLAPVILETPVLKSIKNEPDRVEMADFEFDRCRAQLLANSHEPFVVAIGGSPNSGKSTFATSIFLECKRVMEACVRDGIIPEAPGITLVDMDRSARTSELLLRGTKVDKSSRRPWGNTLCKEALRMLEEAKKEKNKVIFCDLPGGAPDEITRTLAQEATHSILIDRSQFKGGPWELFLLNPDIPVPYVIAAHTRFGEIDRTSGVRVLNRNSRGEPYNFLRGRITNLKREPKFNDPFIKLAAYTLLFDFLPEEILGQLRKKALVLPPTTRRK